MPASSALRVARTMVALLVFGTILIFLGGRLAWLQLGEGPALAAAARAQQDRHLQIVPARGEILDSAGNVLAENQMAESLYALPPDVTDAPAEAATIAQITGLPEAGIQQTLTSKAPWAWVAHRLPRTQYKALLKKNLPGLFFQQEAQRVYPAGNLAASVLGFTGSGGKGLDGVEYYFNQQLAGTPGSIVEAVDAYGNPLPQAPLQYTPPKNGLTVQLTLNAQLEYMAQTMLTAAVAQHHARSGLALMLNVRTGAIVVMANVPGFNPNNWQASPSTTWRNPVVQSDVQPGSIFKPIVASASIDSGDASPTTRYRDPTGYIRIQGATIYNWNYIGLGLPTMTEGLEQSDNVVFSQVAMNLGVSRLYKYFDRFGLNRPTGVDLPGEASSIMPQPATVYRLELATMGFGQTLAVTPLQLLTAEAAIANGGRLMWPHIEKALIAPDGRVVATVKPRVERQVISQATATAVTKMMEAVVYKGLGTTAQIPGYLVAGKTGTAQIASPKGGYLPNTYVVSFVGFAPANHPALICLVMVSRPKGPNAYGSTIAGPVVARLLAQGLHDMGIPPTLPVPPATPTASASSGG